jgi:hypothetical protein
MLMPGQPVPAPPVSLLACGAVQTMPFARPYFDALLAAIDIALTKNCPACGGFARTI